MITWESKDGLVKKEILVPGYFSDKPTESSVCTVIINNPQINNASIQESVNKIRDELHSEIINDQEKKDIIIGKGCSIVDRLLERAIQTMSLCEKSLINLTVPFDDSQNVITITMEITLDNAIFHKPIWNWTVKEKYEASLRFKLQGIELFKANRYFDAFHRFSKACKFIISLVPLEENEELACKLKELKVMLYNNMAECQLLKQNHEHVITLCNKVLSTDGRNIKALYRRGVSHGNLKDFERAIADLKLLLSIDPNNSQAQQKFNYFNEQWQKSVKTYENIVKKMFK